MKILYPINQHFVIWSFLCGDHALKSNIDLLDKKLLNDPNLLSPIENQLRYEVFKSKRNWIAEEMGDRASFALAKISIGDLKTFDTCFENISFDDFVLEYKRAYENKRDMVNDRSQYFMKRHYKPFSSVQYEYDLKNKLTKTYKEVTENQVLDYTQKNDKNLSLALNRCFIMKKCEKYIIMDGMHRLSAYYWSKVFDKEKNCQKKSFASIGKLNISMRYIILLLLLLSCENTRIQKYSICGQVCHPDIKKAGIGVCQLGFWECDGRQGPECIGYVPAGKEICDGLDNDCDGAIDDSLVQTCQSQCGIGFEICVNGKYINCDAPKPQIEICDGLDNDCNGKVDDFQFISQPCYSGDAGELMYGECHPGSSRCIAGKIQCINQQLPHYEMCDGKDNDCDGEIDENVTKPNRLIDIVFVIDESGSMESVIRNIANVSKTWVTKYNNRADLKFAVVAAPWSNSSYDGQTLLIQDLANASIASVALSNQYSGNCAYEPTWDAIYLLSNSLNELGLTWRNNSVKVIIMFTDEEGQSYEYNPPLVLQEVVDMAVQENRHVYVFTVASVYPSYQPIANATDGGMYNLYLSQPEMESVLDSIVAEETCK